MEGVTSADQIATFEPKKVIVSVFIISGYDLKVAEWLDHAWNQIHFDSGAHWYLLVPVKEKSDLGLPMSIDVRVSNEIREMYGINKNQTPCLVFDNFLEDRQYRLSLKGNDEYRKLLMLDMAKRLKEEVEMLGGQGPTDQWRREVTERLFTTGQLSGVQSVLTSNAFSFLSAGAKALAKIYHPHPL